MIARRTTEGPRINKEPARHLPEDKMWLVNLACPSLRKHQETLAANVETHACVHAYARL
jgi:hypothetical protein